VGKRAKKHKKPETLGDLGPGDFGQITKGWVQISWSAYAGAFVRDVEFDDGDQKSDRSEPYFLPATTELVGHRRNKDYYASRARGPAEAEFDPLSS
jgi:hypothetical protein